MMSRARMSRTLRTVFDQDAVELARQAGLRQRTMSFTELVYLLVLGWWKKPQAGPSALARFAGSLDVQIDKQTVDCHLTERTATWRLPLLQRVVAQVVCARAIALPVVHQFRAVFLEDGSTISLPSARPGVGRGCGGSTSRTGKDAKTQAALKITLRWDLLHGQLHGPFVQEGRRHELKSLLHTQQMPTASLWIADLGDFTLHGLHQINTPSVCFLLRYKARIVLWLTTTPLALPTFP